MRKITACILSASALISAAFLGTGYYTGERIQKSFEDFSQKWSDGASLRIEVFEYKRGIIKSHATTKWSLLDGEDEVNFTVAHDIAHGLWAHGHAGAIDSSLHLPLDTNDALVKALQGQTLLRWKTQISWDGTSKHIFSSPELTATFEDSSDLRWNGANGEIKVSATKEIVEGWLDAPSLYLKAENGYSTQIIDNYITFSSTAPSKHRFWTGPFSLKVGGIKFSESDETPILTISDYSMYFFSEVHNEILQSKLITNIGNIEIPGYSSSGIKAEIQAKNINANWLDQLITWSQGDTQDEALQVELLRSIPDFLSHHPELSLEKFSIDTPEGKTEVQAKISYAGKNPHLLTPFLDLRGSLHISIPQKLLELLMGEKVRNDYSSLIKQLNQDYSDDDLQKEVDIGVRKRIKNLINYGLIEKQNDNFFTKIDYEQGQIKINNMATSLEQLIGIGNTI